MHDCQKYEMPVRCNCKINLFTYILGCADARPAAVLRNSVKIPNALGENIDFAVLPEKPLDFRPVFQYTERIKPDERRGGAA